MLLLVQMSDLCLYPRFGGSDRFIGVFTKQQSNDPRRGGLLCRDLCPTEWHPVCCRKIKSQKEVIFLMTVPHGMDQSFLWIAMSWDRVAWSCEIVNVFFDVRISINTDKQHKHKKETDPAVSFGLVSFYIDFPASPEYNYDANNDKSVVSRKGLTSIKMIRWTLWRKYCASHQLSLWSFYFPPQWS